MIQQLIAFILAQLAAGNSTPFTDADGQTLDYVEMTTLRPQFPQPFQLDSAIAENMAVIASALQVKAVDATGTLIVWENPQTSRHMQVLAVTVVPALLPGYQPAADDEHDA